MREKKRRKTMENPLDSLVRMLAVFTDPFPSKTSHLILKMQ